MKNSDYWKERFEQLEKANHKSAVETLTGIDNQYKIANKEIEEQISAWYQRFATNNQISMAEARRLLGTKELAEFKWSVEEYIKYGEQYGLDPAWMKKLENASSRFHVSRLEALKLQLQQTSEKLFGGQSDNIDTLLKKTYLDNYYHTAYEVQKGFNVGWDIAGIDEKALKRVISKPWATDGKNFSERIWMNKTNLINEVHTQLTQTIMLGKSPSVAINNISKKMGTSKSQASRLVMTESAYFSSQSQKDCFNELDVERFEIVATLDSSTSAICQEMDGKIFPMTDYEPAITAPPFHPWCRSVTVPYFDDNFTERAARGADGKTYYVDGNMKYPEWKEKYVKDAAKPTDISQFEKYKEAMGKNAPQTLDKFLEIKYNNKEEWNNLKEKIEGTKSLQIQLSYVSGGVSGFIPKGTKFSSVPKIIAGKTHPSEIRDINRLIKVYGGSKEGWTKRVVKIESQQKCFDIHYYELDGVQYETKISNWKERPK